MQPMLIVLFSIIPKNFNVINKSFVSAEIKEKYDVIIGNPPYIRWKNLEDNLKTELETSNLWKTYCNSLCDYSSVFILKAAELLKENGIESDEIKAFMEEYKTYKSGKSSSKEKELEELKIKNAELLKTIKSGERKSAISKVAKKLGISDEHLVYVEKLSDSSKFEKDGHFNEAEIESEFSKVLESIPGLKAQKEKEQEPGFVKIGGTKQETPNELLTENKLRRAFGLPEITK